MLRIVSLWCLLCGFALFAWCQTHQEEAAAEALRAIHVAEVDYSASHVKEGYACQLSKLRQATKSKPNDVFFKITSGKYAGYRYELKCKGRSYVATAVPEEPQAGHVFCIDDSGLLLMSQTAQTCITDGKTPDFKSKAIPNEKKQNVR